MSRPAPPRASKKSLWTRPSRRSCVVITLIVSAVSFFLVCATLIVYLGLRDLLSRDEADSGMRVEVVKLTPTVATFLTPSPSASPLPPPSCKTIVSSDDVEVAVSLPISITVGGEPFPVVPVMSEEKGWTYPASYSGSAAWVCGTVVNYVVGLEPTPENETLLTGLRPGDEIKMHLSNGVGLFFHFVERREVEANAASVFEQAQPRLTLVLEREDGTWQIATADYVSETEPVQPASDTLAQPGQSVRVGDAQVTVLRGYAERSEPDLLPGTMYYVVELSVENMGEEPLDANAFAMQLQDGMGNEYLLSPAASAAGEYGPLRGEIVPATTVQGAAGYLVPETLAGPELIWTFSPSPGSELRASVSIPYETSAGPISAGQAEVIIDEEGTFLSSNGDVLVIGGEVRNIGDEPITVELSDISLTSTAGMSALRSAAPPLPWTIQPGQTQVTELQYERPNASTALLALLGYSFEIRGLQ